MLSITLLKISHQQIMFLAINLEPGCPGIMPPIIVRGPMRRGILPQSKRNQRIHRMKRSRRMLKRAIH